MKHRLIYIISSKTMVDLKIFILKIQEKTKEKERKKKSIFKKQLYLH